MDGGGFKVSSSGDVFKAGKVINAAGVHAPALANKLGLDVPITPRKGHILVASRSELMGTRKIQEFGYLMTEFGKEREASKPMYDYGIALVHESTESQNFLLASSRGCTGLDKTEDEKKMRLRVRRVTKRTYCTLQHDTHS